MDEYGAINAYVKVTGRSHLSSSQNLHLTEDILFRLQKLRVGGGKDLHVPEVVRTATRWQRRRILTLQAIAAPKYELSPSIQRSMSPFLPYIRSNQG